MYMERLTPILQGASSQKARFMFDSYFFFLARSQNRTQGLNITQICETFQNICTRIFHGSLEQIILQLRQYHQFQDAQNRMNPDTSGVFLSIQTYYSNIFTMNVEQILTDSKMINHNVRREKNFSLYQKRISAPIFVRNLGEIRVRQCVQIESPSAPRLDSPYVVEKRKKNV